MCRYSVVAAVSTVKCAVCSTVCRCSVVAAVSTVKIYKIVTFITITLRSQPITLAAVQVDVIIHIYFQVG